MFAVKSRLDVFVRIVIIASVLFNALAPIPGLAKATENQDVQSTSEAAPESSSSLSEQEPLYFDPPQLPELQGRSPDPDEPPSRVPL